MIRRPPVDRPWIENMSAGLPIWFHELSRAILCNVLCCEADCENRLS